MVNRLMEVICEKVGQMPPNVMNVLVVSIEEKYDGNDLPPAATRLKTLADQKAEGFFAERGFKNAADFYRQYQNLSAIITQQPQVDGESPPMWLNPIARYPLARELITALEKVIGSSK